MEGVNVVVKEDKSVEKLINKRARKLQQKYTRKRRINEKLLKKQTPLQRTFSVIGDILCVMIVVFAGIVCFSGLNSRLQHICPTFAGYSNLTVVTGSMINSGFNPGDSVVVRSVNAKTLHEGDKIAFYVYSKDYNSFDIDTCAWIRNENIPENEYVTNFVSIFGFQKRPIIEAAKSNAKLVFHHIRKVYEDPNGQRWFKTYGSSNSDDDAWYISENMIVGLYCNTKTAHFFAKVISIVNSGFGFLLLLIPLLLLSTIIVIESLKNAERAKLELDCVEEKRKITDPICVKNNVGFNMDTKTKYKILAQSTPKNRNEYISLLWREGTAPASIRKYYSRKNILLAYDRKMLKLNRECEKMFKDGVNAKKIATYYNKQKQLIGEEQITLRQELKKKAE